MEQLNRKYIDDFEEDLVSPDNSHEIDMTNIINNAHTLEELFEILESLGEIKGSNQVFSGEDIVSQIEAVQNKRVTLETIPKTFGLRNKVLELLEGNVFSTEVSDQKLMDTIGGAETIEELVNICNHIESIDTSVGPVEGKEIATIIENIQNKTMPLENLTRTGGLRDKVSEILGDDVLSQEGEEQEQITQVRTALLEKTEEAPDVSVLEQAKQELDSLQSAYQEAYENHRNLIAQQPTGLKKLFSFFKNKKELQEGEAQVNSLKQQYQEKEAEYLDIKEKIVPFHE